MFINILFFSASALVIASCALMMWTKNLMHSCVYLLGVLIGVAGLYLTLGADFVAATQIMVYVGGVVILMLFAVMLTGGKDFQSKTQQLLNLLPSMGNKYTFMWGGGVGLVFAGCLTYFFMHLFKVIKVQEIDNNSYSPTIEKLGELLVTDHLVAFELSSVLLLGALVGAAIIARPRKERPAYIDDIEHDHHHDEEHH